MHFRQLRISAAVAVSVSTLVTASPANADPATLSGYAYAATEGIGRGFSITNGKMQYGVGAQVNAGGFYASATTQRFAIAGATNETYLIAGYARTFGKLTVDVSGVRYLYNSKAAADFWEGAIVLRHPVGPATVEVAARGSVDYFANAGHALYTYADVSAPLWSNGKTAVSMSARLGREEIEKNGVLGAPDWLYYIVGVKLRHGPAVIDLGYHDTDIPGALGLPADPKVVAGLTLAF